MTDGVGPDYRGHGFVAQFCHRGHALRPLSVERRMVAMFKPNVGTVDRFVRILFGLVLLSLVFVGPKTLWGWIGILPVLTGLISFCPLYALIGLNTQSAK
jgi:hypothetical protein